METDKKPSDLELPGGTSFRCVYLAGLALLNLILIASAWLNHFCLVVALRSLPTPWILGMGVMADPHWLASGSSWGVLALWDIAALNPSASELNA